MLVIANGEDSLKVSLKGVCQTSNLFVLVYIFFVHLFFPLSAPLLILFYNQTFKIAIANTYSADFNTFHFIFSACFLTITFVLAITLRFIAHIFNSSQVILYHFTYSITALQYYLYFLIPCIYAVFAIYFHFKYMINPNSYWY